MKSFILVLLIFLVSPKVFAGADISSSLAATRKIYYLLAAPKGTGRSFAGHAYLRLSTHEQPSSEDTVIEFIADTSPENISYLKAFGISDPYDRKVVTEPYRQVQYSMNYLSDRTLTSYELTLNPFQQKIFLQKLAAVINAGQMGKYSFLSNNCAQAVSELFSIVGVDLGWPIRILPTQIPGALKKKSLVGNITKDFSLTDRRQNLVAQYSLLQNILTPSELKKLSAEETYARIATLLLAKKQSKELAENDRFTLKTYLLAASFLENRFVREDLIQHFNDKTVFDLDKILNFKADIRYQIERLFGRNATAATVKLLQTKIQSSNKRLTLVHQIQILGKGSNSGLQKVLHLKQDLHGTPLRVGASHEILFKGQVLGHLVSSELNKEGTLITQGWLQSQLVENEGRLTITTFVVREPIRNQPLKNLTFENESSLKNNNPQDPMCFGLVDLQKRLLENTIWRPDLKAQSPKENLALLEKLILGKILVIPGFNNAQEWTEALPKAAFIKLVSTYHKAKYNQLSSAIRTYFDQIPVTERNLKFIEQKAQRGIHTPLFFRTHTGIGHAILATNIRQSPTGKTYVEAYDPNVISKRDESSGFTRDVFEINPKTGVIKSFMYGESQAYFLNETLSSEYQTREILANPSALKLLQTYSEKTGKYFFDLADLATVY